MKRISFLMLIFIGVTAISPAQSESFKQEGIASWYGEGFVGKKTASGEIFDPDLFTAAHPTLPFGSVLIVTNKQNMRQVKVRINDRGPFVPARIIDLSKAAAEILDMINSGIVPVSIEQSTDTSLGPVTTLAVGNSPVQALSSVDEASPIVTAPPAAISIETQVIRESYPVNPPIEEKINAPDTRVQLPTLPAPVIYPGPAAVIKGGIPPENSAKSYRLQVGSFKVPKNAADVFDRLKKAGLNPAYEERKDDFYRVVLPGLKAEEIPSIAQTLGNSGFREAIIREEN